MATVLISAPYIIPQLDRIQAVFEHYGMELIVPHVSERLDEETLMAYAGEFDGAICGDDQYTEQVLEACAPRLKVISKWGTGVDSIDKDTADKLGIQVHRTPNAFTMPVADTVLMKSGEWQKVPGRSLGECSLGVVGVGNCGRAVLRRARGFGMKLLGNDIVDIAPDFVIETGVEMTGLGDLLARSDFVSVNCDLNPSSYHLINADALASMNPDAVLINTARGSVVDETALIEGLQRRELGGAGLDVFEIEPLPEDSPLRQFDNVMLAPHNANSSPMAWEHVHWNTIRNLLTGLGLETDGLEVIKKRKVAPNDK